jgi:hypothetical protein
MMQRIAEQRNIRAAALLSCLLLAYSAAAGEDVNLPRARVELTVRGPDGRPVSGKEISVGDSGRHYFPSEQHPEATVKSDAQGRITVDWPIGLRKISVSVSGVGYGSTGHFELREKTVARPSLPLLVPSGTIDGQVTRVSIRPTASAIQGRQEKPLADRSGGGKPVACATGTVRDVSGLPLRGVKVFLLAEFGGTTDNDSVNVVSTFTDAKGAWQFPKPEGRRLLGGIVVAHLPGRPYAGAILADPSSDGVGPSGFEAASYDLVLPAGGGRLEATVTQQGRLLRGTAVRIERESPLVDQIGSTLDHPSGTDPELLAGLLKPTALTDAYGVVRFSELVPGEYHLVAVAGDKRELNNFSPVFSYMYQGSYAKVDSVAVRRDETTKFRVALLPRAKFRVAINLQRPNGRHYADREWAIDSSYEEKNLNNTLFDQAVTSPYYIFGGEGLHKVTCSALDRKLYRNETSDLPGLQADAQIAVSPLLPAKPAIVLTAARRELGSLLVKVEDPQGKPLAAHVLIDGWRQDEGMAGTTDARGEVRFEGIPDEGHFVDVYPEGTVFPDFGSGDDPLPTDDKLGREFLPAELNAATPRSEETRLTVRVARAGYLRVRVHAPPGLPADRFSVTHPESDAKTYRERRHKASGEYLLGPLPEGKAAVLVYDHAALHPRRAILRRELEVTSGRVAHYTIEIPEAPATKIASPSSGTSSQACSDATCGCMLTDNLPEIRGHVFMSDGKTPAYGALLAYVMAKTDGFAGIGEVDALGRISMMPRGCWNFPSAPLPGNPTEPVLMCGLPGTCGMIVMPESERAKSGELRIVLPPPLSATGRVTIGGRPAQPREHQFVVNARYQGVGKLAPAMSREVATDADGSFRLNALTPGTYLVQASLDNIWLSASIRLKVDASAPNIPPLTLDIPAPGPGLNIKVVDKAGKPVADARATVSRPEGPINDGVWPKDFRTDGAGVLHIRPLESGRQTIRVQGADDWSVDVPPLAGLNAIETGPIVVK